jgi:hypothetical protein
LKECSPPSFSHLPSSEYDKERKQCHHLQIEREQNPMITKKKKTEKKKEAVLNSEIAAGGQKFASLLLESK